MTKYRTKIVEIEAIQFDGTRRSAGAICKWANSYPSEGDEGWADYTYTTSDPNEAIDDLLIHTLEGSMQVSKGDFVIKGLADEFYPCKPDIFTKKYEAVE